MLHKFFSLWCHWLVIVACGAASGLFTRNPSENRDVGMFTVCDTGWSLISYAWNDTYMYVRDEYVKWYSSEKQLTFKAFHTPKGTAYGSNWKNLAFSSSRMTWLEFLPHMYNLPSSIKENRQALLETSSQTVTKELSYFFKNGDSPLRFWD